MKRGNLSTPKANTFAPQPVVLTPPTRITNASSKVRSWSEPHQNIRETGKQHLNYRSLRA